MDFSGNVIGGCTISADELGDFDQPPALSKMDIYHAVS